MISAIEFGEKHRSCAMAWRRSLGPGATQAYAWKACERGDHLIWQLRKLPDDKLQAITPALLRAVNTIVSRAGTRNAEAAAWAAEAGAARAARAAVWAAVWAAEAAGDAAEDRAAELKKQAEDIRAEIPEWPGE